MASCEKCWRDADSDPFMYRKLVSERKCTPEEQAGGKDAFVCPKCGRKALHMWCMECMACGYDEQKGGEG